MVVEDQGVVALDLQRRLQAMGHRVVARVGSGEDAIRVAEREKPDVALMDLRLRGEMDGWTAARALRERFGTSIVYVSAQVDAAAVARAAGEAAECLPKPIHEDVLRAAVARAVARSVSRRAPGGGGAGGAG
jgi:CheY-like chemotaxis protein